MSDILYACLRCPPVRSGPGHRGGDSPPLGLRLVCVPDSTCILLYPVYNPARRGRRVSGGGLLGTPRTPRSGADLCIEGVIHPSPGFRIVCMPHSTCVLPHPCYPPARSGLGGTRGGPFPTPRMLSFGQFSFAAVLSSVSTPGAGAGKIKHVRNGILFSLV